ncbi:MAG: M48 family metalloprotease [Mariprofundaceae bacterium]|nr:M48 family metalloprotease [Mariprofundaceae bacterium]
MIRVSLMLLMLFACGNPVLAFNFSIGGFGNGDRNSAIDIRRIQQGLRLISALVPISDQDEIKLGRGVAARVISRFGIDYNLEATYYLNLLGTTISQRADRPGLPYHFAILDTDDVNAYACPGGFVFITRGALNMVQDEAELAAVLSHEIAHVTERHIIKALQHSQAMKIGAQMAADAFTNGGPLFEKMINTATDSLFKGLKKGDEYDADRKAIAYLDRTGYDYPAMFDVLNLLDQRRKAGQTKVLAKTHPSPASRIRKLRKAMRKLTLDRPTGIRLRARFDQRLQIKKSSS